MLQIFTASGYVSRMCCSISRMARVCRVNSPSFCRDTTGQHLLGQRTPASPLGILFPLSHTAQGPEGTKAPRPQHCRCTSPGPRCPHWPLGSAPSGNLGKDLKEIEDPKPSHFLSTSLMSRQTSHESAQQPTYNGADQEGRQSPQGVNSRQPRSLPGSIPGASQHCCLEPPQRPRSRPATSPHRQSWEPCQQGRGRPQGTLWWHWVGVGASPVPGPDTVHTPCDLKSLGTPGSAETRGKSSAGLSPSYREEAAG